MPNIPCPQIISCPGGDSPFQNWTSEQPDQVMYVGLNWGWDHNVPPIGSQWSHSSCLGICISTISQQDADLCAAANNLRCLSDANRGDPADGDGGGGPVPPFNYFPPIGDRKVYYSAGQSCTVNCPDGSPFTYVLKPGEVVAESQIMADRIALSIACQRAAASRFCLTSNLGPCYCSGQTLTGNNSIAVLGPGAPFNIRVTSGQLPTGTSLLQTSDTTAILSGQFTASGTYVFTVTATSKQGLETHHIYTILVLEISNATSLPDGKVDNAYSATLTGAGGTGPYTFALAPGASLLTGLTLSSAGVISGTYTGLPVSSMVNVSITDSSSPPATCTATVTITMNGPKMTSAAPPDGTMCTAYSFQFTALPVGCQFTTISTLPAGLTLTIGGLLSGTCKQTFNNTLIIIVLDPATLETNTYTYPP